MDRCGLDLVAPDDPEVERIWRALEEQTEPAYFLSWGWISAWRAALPAAERPPLAVIHDGREVAAAFFLAQRRVRRNLVLQSNALYVNATGLPAHDDLCMAHNRILTAPGARRSLAHVIELLPTDWDELHVPAVDSRAFDDLRSTPYKIRLEREQLVPFVDLAQSATAMPAGVDLDVATTVDEALAIYDELVQVRPLSAWSAAFHRQLLLARFAHGEIQLLRVRHGSATLGCLYNLVYRGRVYSHLAGLTGDVAHATQRAALAYNASCGHTTYECGDESLATGTSRLVWLTVQRPLAWIAIEDTARRWYDALLGDRRLPAVA